jgi:hypothetical protein
MITRVREVVWVLDHARDVAADLRVFAHVSWAEALAWPGPEFLALAYRLPAYGGALAARVAAQDGHGGAGHAGAARGGAGRRPGAREVPGTREAIMAEPGFAGVIEFG